MQQKPMAIRVVAYLMWPDIFMWNYIQCLWHAYLYRIRAPALLGDLLATGLLGEDVSASLRDSIQQTVQYTYSVTVMASCKSSHSYIWCGGRDNQKRIYKMAAIQYDKCILGCKTSEILILYAFRQDIRYLSILNLASIEARSYHWMYI